MRALRNGVVGMVAGLLLALSAAVAASAHDELIASSPAEGEALASAPETVTLTFTADVMTLGAAIVVADGSGVDWVAGEPVIDGGTLTVPLREGMPDAGYEIRWRVVSADGHPIAGLVPFTIGDAAPLVMEPPRPEAESGDADENDQSTQADAAMRLVIIGAGGAASAVAVYALIHLIRRRKRGGAPEGVDESVAAGDSIERHENL
ncbi:copper resistance CopC family protein [Microbacterium sp. BWT-B31]|uniref:copper resistance CopC family protein n=1 Tax=Microbacterium sp. BWT-B31 TaxID=3232072 RepID=UPI003528DFEE